MLIVHCDSGNMAKALVIQTIQCIIDVLDLDKKKQTMRAASTQISAKVLEIKYPLQYKDF